MGLPDNFLRESLFLCERITFSPTCFANCPFCGRPLGKRVGGLLRSFPQGDFGSGASNSETLAFCNGTGNQWFHFGSFSLVAWSQRALADLPARPARFVSIPSDGDSIDDRRQACLLRRCFPVNWTKRRNGSKRRFF